MAADLGRKTEKYRQIYRHHIVFPPEHRTTFNIRRSLTVTLLNPKHPHTETVFVWAGVIHVHLHCMLGRARPVVVETE